MILEIDNVELNFKQRNILKGVYLKAETGMVTGILGSNGSGKSCLINIIFGNLTPKYKLLRLDSKPLLKPLFLTKRVAFLPQHHFIPHQLKLLSVFKMFSLSWKDFVNTFVQFTFYKNIKFNRLSGGERRLVETYIILKSNRDIILLDEPFSHLAPLYIEGIKALIAKEKLNKTIIITDHLYQHIIDISDTIYLVKNGQTKRINNLLELEDYKYLSAGSLE